MKSIAVLSFLLFSFSLSAQLQIKSGDIPKPGTKSSYVNTETEALLQLVELRGKDQKWFFTARAEDTIVVDYLSSSVTPFASQFFNTTAVRLADDIEFGEYALTDMYAFYTHTPALYSGRGLSFRVSVAPIPLAAVYSDHDEIYVFPMYYGQFNFSTYRLGLEIPNLGYYASEGYRVTETVGEGMAYFAHDTLRCLMIMSTVKGYDSIVSPPNVALGMPTERTEYKWLSPGKGVIAEVSGVVTDGVFTPNLSRYSTTSENKGPGSGVDEPNEAISIRLYPNPASSKLIVQGFYDELLIFDLLGNLALHCSDPVEEIDISSLKPGIYTVKIIRGPKSRQAKLVVRTNGQ